MQYIAWISWRATTNSSSAKDRNIFYQRKHAGPNSNKAFLRLCAMVCWKPISFLKKQYEKLFSVPNQQSITGRRPNKVKHGGSRIMMWGFPSSNRTGCCHGNWNNIQCHLSVIFHWNISLVELYRICVMLKMCKIVFCWFFSQFLSLCKKQGFVTGCVPFQQCIWKQEQSPLPNKLTI